MTPRKFKILVATFCYGGNGSTRSSVPDVYEWLLPNVAKWHTLPSVEEVRLKDFSDTPITMTRNKSVLYARNRGYDFILMIDSDMKPDNHLREPGAKPFFESSWEYILKHYDRGPLAVLAPYSGPPPFELPYAFRWESYENDSLDDTSVALEMYDREEAEVQSGIGDIAAGPTGLALFDMRLFELLEPVDEDDMSWFYYEWKDKYQAEKASTEDVTFTRDASMFGIEALGYNPVKCNWDAWAGHWKPKCVGKPRHIPASDVGKRYRKAIKRLDASQRILHVDTSLPKMDYDATQRSQIGEKRLERSHRFGKFMNLNDRRSSAIASKLKQKNATLDDCAALMELVRQADPGNRPMRCAEVGSFIGDSAKLILDAAGREATLICVDHWKGSSDPFDPSARAIDVISEDEIYNTFLYQTREYGDRITVIRAESVEAAQQVEGGSLDLVYIDADHTYEGVKRDIVAWVKKVRRGGGILCGHDYGAPNFPGVKQAVGELFPGVHQVKHDVWWVQFDKVRVWSTNGQKPAKKRKKVKV